MTTPGYLLGFLLASLIGVMFHLWRGGHIGRLVLFLVLSWAGFWAGHFIGDKISFSLGRIGVLNVGLAILGSLIFLIGGSWLTRFEKK